METKHQADFDVLTFLLVADENLQCDSSLHLDWHLIVID